MDTNEEKKTRLMTSNNQSCCCCCGRHFQWQVHGTFSVSKCFGQWITFLYDDYFALIKIEALRQVTHRSSHPNAMFYLSNDSNKLQFCSKYTSSKYFLCNIPHCLTFDWFWSILFEIALFFERITLLNFVGKNAAKHFYVEKSIFFSSRWASYSAL